MGELIAQALRQDGADPHIGRKLRKYFVEAGLATEVSVISSLWNQEQLAHEFEEEWLLLEKDLENLVDRETLHRYRQDDEQAIKAGWRLIFMPIFYALGKK